MINKFYSRKNKCELGTEKYLLSAADSNSFSLSIYIIFDGYCNNNSINQYFLSIFNLCIPQKAKVLESCIGCLTIHKSPPSSCLAWPTSLEISPKIFKTFLLFAGSESSLPFKCSNYAWIPLMKSWKIRN